MIRIPTLFLFSILTLGLVATACRQQESAAPAPTAETAAPAETPEAAQVTYEPAYPADVSDESLQEGDVAQQEATHSHGGQAHTHDEDEPHDEDHEH